MNHLRDLPPLRSIPCEIDALLYNHARLALLRIGSPLEMELESLAVDVVLEHRQWIAYHSQQAALPLIAWEGFETSRSALNEPVSCTMHLYHHHSWLQFSRILRKLDWQLQSLLSPV